MCGINGIIFKNPERKVESLIQLMNNSIIHRGPDDSGIYIDETPDFALGFGMRRLSIIDISNGHQPIISEDGNFVIVFNGEIYNYLVLKYELEKLGVLFSTNSDTEVILKLYELEGTKAFEKLDGMFSVSIYDKKLKQVFIARDYFGEKPLYYTHNEHEFIWASELKSITKVLQLKPKINFDSLNLFFRLTYIPAPFTIYENIYKLEPNHFIAINVISCEIKVNEIYQDKSRAIDFKKTDFCTIVHDKVFDSVISRSVSDVPIGTFLSGGVDSSIVSLCLSKNTSNKIDTFSLGFEKDSFDESDKALTVAKIIGSNHHTFKVGEKNLYEHLNVILDNFDEPFADSSALPSFLLAEETRKFVKVALTGDGGDEVFGGYNKYYMGKLNRTITNYFPEILFQNSKPFFSNILKVKDDNRGIRFKLNKLIHSIDYNDDFYFHIICLGFQKEELNSILKNNYCVDEYLNYYKNKSSFNNKTLTDFRNIDRLISLEGDMLVKVDRTSMLTSLECRAPFLNKELWDITNQIPENLLIKGWDKKHILKKSFNKYFPKGFLYKSKKGFGVPVGDWLRTFLKKELQSYIETSLLQKQNIFNEKEISILVNQHLCSISDNTFKIWTFFCFQRWYFSNYE